jgi:nucleotide-binding universal stress UspA family protein
MGMVYHLAAGFPSAGEQDNCTRKAVEAVMLDIRRILCPIDYSNASRHALDQTRMIAAWFGAAVTVLYVAPPPRRVVEVPLFLAALPSTALQTPASPVSTRLAELVGPLRTAGLTVDERVVEDYDVEGRILASAASLTADLIVLGTHGRTGLGWLMLGSVTDKLLRAANCPVLTVPPTAMKAAKPPFKRVLCPVDFSEASLHAVRLAIVLAQEGDARLTLLHVLPASAAHDSFTMMQAHRCQREQAAREDLERLLPVASRTFCSPATKVTWGAPYRSIVEVANSEGTDLIVMGVRRRGILDRVFAGFNTSQVVRHATCPVLTIRV